ncbi:MAG: glycoside hydrolase family 99-like domain-containing protein [Gallionellaceae bacterium]|nr:glycoside hydrolase family 99-like domain-containing protein [Gallionellaceae bacterium]
MSTPDVRAIAFYLPQYHPVPENDQWWGKGFTEWRNVAKARPLFSGHYQPHMPADLGFYDLRLADVREEQAALARHYGIHGFCYYHYWFNGRRILERPFNEVLASGKPDFPFCLCWANENWTRIWDGGAKNVLLEQKYSEADDLSHIESLIPAFFDDRYIRVDGKPLFLVYRTGLLPSPLRTTQVWREAARKAGIGELFLVRVESHGDSTNPSEIGFDASVDFAPFNGLPSPLLRGPISALSARLGFLPTAFIDHQIVDYQSVASILMSRPIPDFKRFYCVTPGWDNTSRRKQGGVVLLDSTPKRYERWLHDAVRKTRQQFKSEENIVFINAWNEWAEGNHMEPDMKWGRAFLEATLRVISTSTSNESLTRMDAQTPVEQTGIRQAYWKILGRLRASRARRFLKYFRVPCRTRIGNE